MERIPVGEQLLGKWFVLCEIPNGLCLPHLCNEQRIVFREFCLIRGSIRIGGFERLLQTGRTSSDVPQVNRASVTDRQPSIVRADRGGPRPCFSNAQILCERFTIPLPNGTARSTPDRDQQLPVVRRRHWQIPLWLE